MIKAVIFDMGGVILRTVDPGPRERMAERFGRSREEMEDFVFNSPSSVQSEIGKLSDMDHWRIALKHFNQPVHSPEDAYYEFFSGDAINQDLLKYARSLKPDIRIGLLSNAWENARERLGQLYKFIEYFDVVVFSSETGTRKPDKKIFKLTLEKFDAKPKEAVFIDDFAINVRGARAAGLHAVHFRENEQAISAVNELIKAG